MVSNYFCFPGADNATRLWEQVNIDNRLNKYSELNYTEDRRRNEIFNLYMDTLDFSRDARFLCR